MTDKEVFEYHGWREQCKHITSEMYELTEAIHDFEDAKKSIYTQDFYKLKHNIEQEIADVEFMLNQIKDYYELQQQIINDWGKYKRKRESKRIKEGYYEKK